MLGRIDAQRSDHSTNVRCEQKRMTYTVTMTGPASAGKTRGDARPAVVCFGRPSASPALYPTHDFDKRWTSTARPGAATSQISNAWNGWETLARRINPAPYAHRRNRAKIRPFGSSEITELDDALPPPGASRSFHTHLCRDQPRDDPPLRDWKSERLPSST